MNKYLLVDYDTNTISSLAKVETDFEENEKYTSSCTCIDRKDMLNMALDIIKEDIQNYAYEHDIRVCSECGHLMDNGYCIENGIYYYCSEKCLHKNMSEEEFLKLYDDGNGDSYWTEWEEK